MMRFLKGNIYLILIIIVSFIIFFPSLFAFYTNDDFFFLKIANVSSLNDFFSFFNLIKDTGNIGVYRPLTLRVFYFLTVEFFHLNSLPLHIISFATFFADVFLVGRLARLLTKNNKIALLSSFLYAVSATHFGQLYYIGMFQELFLTLLFLASVIFFIEYELEEKRSAGKLIISFIFFILAMMSKETAVVLPVVLVLTHLYLKLTKRANVLVKTFILSLIPYVVVIALYLFLHFRYFGLILGDSYIWNFSPLKAMNTLIWYVLWSFNIPEMLVDFIGPRFYINPNLFRYWSNEMVPILILFLVEICITFYAFIRNKFSLTTIYCLLFTILWFGITLLPILFLPIHKFTYYLTLPLVGVVISLSSLLVNLKSRSYILFCVVWTVVSVLTVRLAVQTSWITQGERISERVYMYFEKNKSNLTSKNIVFVDTPNDLSLPWSPTETVKTALSGNNFFDVFYPNLSKNISFEGEGDVTIESRQFLGY